VVILKAGFIDTYLRLNAEEEAIFKAEKQSPRMRAEFEYHYSKLMGGEILT
jgi:hypothetical protein